MISIPAGSGMDAGMTQSIAVISYNNMQLGDYVSPFPATGTNGPAFNESSGVSGNSSTQGGKMLRPDYSEESAFQDKLNFSKHKVKKKAPVNQYSMGAAEELKKKKFDF